MSVAYRLLQIPWLWNLSQKILGCDAQKRALYRSVFQKPCKVLDFGCADGNIFPAFRDFEYYGLDTDPRLIARAKRRYAAYPNAHFVCCDVLERPFPPASFDAVLFGCTAHHLSDPMFIDVVRALAEVLRGNGVIHFFEPVRGETDPWIVRLKMAFDQGTYIRTEAQYRSLFEELGGDLSVRTMRRLKVTGALTPQPDYLYAELSKQPVEQLPLSMHSLAALSRTSV